MSPEITTSRAYDLSVASAFHLYGCYDTQEQRYINRFALPSLDGLRLELYGPATLSAEEN